MALASTREVGSQLPELLIVQMASVGSSDELGELLSLPRHGCSLV